MFTGRKANKSGTYSVQVVKKERGRYIVVRTFGASSDEEVLSRMEWEASLFISTYAVQQTLDFGEYDATTIPAETLLENITSRVQNGKEFVRIHLQH